MLPGAQDIPYLKHLVSRHAGDMSWTIEVVVAALSSITRISAYIFLRWIPGHHFPPVIVSALLLYLTTIALNSKSFGSGRPSLREAFPKLFKHKDGPPQESTSLLDYIHNEPAIYHDERTIFKTLLLGIPDWKEWEFSYLTILINIFLAILSLDMVFRGPVLYNGTDLRFSRLGHVGDASARILFREPDPQMLPIYVHLKTSSDSDWRTVDTVFYLDATTDYTYPISLSNLQPDTSYDYSLSNKLDGSFKTAPAPGTLEARHLTFVTSSCIKANFPYNPFSHSLSIPGFKHLSNILTSLPSPAAFMVFLGDFIYVDVPFRLSSSQEHYRSEYRRVYSSPSWQLPGLNLPWIHTLDDHEIANDWASGNKTDPFPAASDPFLQYHVSVNPPLPPSAPRGPQANSTYFQFTQGPASFFMMDTRRYRTQPETGTSSLLSTIKLLDGISRPVNHSPEASMLGSTQLNALLSFLRTPEPGHVQWKIITSSVPFTKNWRFGTPDTWGGFLTERRRVLDAMHFAEEHLGVRVIVLSGDRHEFAAIRFAPLHNHLDDRRELIHDAKAELGPHEFSVGPLNMFYLPVRTFKQIDDEDIALEYIPDGNSKLGVIDIAPIKAKDGILASMLKYTLWVDGKVAWEYSIRSPGKYRTRHSNLGTWNLPF